MNFPNLKEKNLGLYHWLRKLSGAYTQKIFRVKIEKSEGSSRIAEVLECFQR